MRKKGLYFLRRFDSFYEASDYMLKLERMGIETAELRTVREFRNTVAYTVTFS